MSISEEQVRLAEVKPSQWRLWRSKQYQRILWALAWRANPPKPNLQNPNAVANSSKHTFLVTIANPWSKHCWLTATCTGVSEISTETCSVLPVVIEWTI
jgi:hypothetical protein